MAEVGRFTTWLSAVERHALETAAREQGKTIATLIRLAVRQYVGTDALKKAACELVGEEPPGVGVTGNNDG